MPTPKYYQITLPSGSSQIWDQEKVDRNKKWLDEKKATASEVNSFDVTLPSGSSQTWDADKYGRNIGWINEHGATVKGSWIGAQQPSGPVGPSAAPPAAKKDPFKPTMELDGAMYTSAPAPLHESSSVPVPGRREVTPEQRSDIRAKVAIGEKVLQRPGKPKETPLPVSSRVAFSEGNEYQLTTRNGDRIPVMLYPNADGVVDNGDGTVNVVVNRAEVDGAPVVSQMSKVEFQQMYDRTLGSEKRDAERTQGKATRDQVRLLSEDIDARLNDLAGTASGRFREMAGKESFAERLNRMMPMTAGGPGPMGMPATADSFNTLSQAEKDDYQALQSAKRSVRDASRIIEEADHNAQSGTLGKWLESSFAGGAARGFGQKFFDIDNWDMGVSDVKDGAALLAALDAFDKGERLTEAQQMLLDAKAVELATNAYFGSYVGRGYKAGSVTAESIPFMIEMCINPASSIGNAATNKMARYAIKRFGKEAAKKGVHRVLRGAGRVGADIAGATLMAGTTGLPGVAGETMERMAGLNGDSVGYDDEGRSFFTGVRDGEDPAEAFAKSFGSRAIENYSEMVGEYFAPIIGGAGKAASKGLEKMHLGKVVDFLDDVNGSDLAKMVGDFEKNARWNGSIGEYAEEVAGGVMNALLVGDQTLDADPETGVFNLDNNIDTFLGVGLMGGAFGAIKTVGYRTPKYRTKKQLDRMDSYGKAAFRNPKDWTDFTGQFAQDPNAALHDVLVGDHTQAERQAALQYAKASMEYQGALATEEKRDVSPEQRDAETSFDNGYSLTEPQEMHDAKVALQARRAALKDEFGEEDINLDELNIEQGAEGWTPEQKAIAMDYINSKATYEGMIQRVKDDIGSRTDEAFAEIDRNTNSDMDSLIPVTMADGRQGYIVRGNVVLGEDGRIDKSQSDKSIIVRDAETGNAEWSTPALVMETAGILDPQAEKEAAAARIGEQVAQAEADKIDGTMQFSEGESRQVVTPDGQLAQMTVTPDDKGVVENEDGTVNVTISSPDGSTRAEKMTREEIGQAVDAADMVRLTEYDATRVMKDQEQATRDEEALAPYAAIPRGADVNVHWETGDATYRFEGARLDEDGQVVFDAVDPENEEAGAIEIPASEVTNMKELLGIRSEPTVSEMETVGGTPAPEAENTAEEPAETPAPTVPVSGSGIKQYQQAPVEATYQDIYTDPAFETPEEAAGFVSGKIRRTEAALADAEKALSAVRPEDYDVPADYKAARDAARQPVETARQALDYWNAVRTYAEQQAAAPATHVVAETQQAPAPATEPAVPTAGPTGREVQRKQNLSKGRQALRQRGYYYKELDAIDASGEVGSFKDFIRRTLLRNQEKLKWDDSKDGTQKGLGSHLNKGQGEKNQRIWLLSKDGKYPEQLADELLEAYAGELGVDTDSVSSNATFALDALLDVLHSEPTPRAMLEGVRAERRTDQSNDRGEQTAYDEMMRDMAEEGRRYGRTLDEQLAYENYLDERAKDLFENYDEINAIFVEERDSYEQQQIREPDEVREGVSGQEGIRGNREGSDALGAGDAGSAGQDRVGDVGDEEQGRERGGDSARRGSVPERTLAEGESASGESREIEGLPEASGENPVVQAINEAAAQVDTNPSDAQKEAGNYRKGHVTVDGYDISIENPKGSVRSGRDSSGKEWSVTMNNNYGYIRRTEGVDGDHIDVFLSDNPTEGKVFVVDQVTPDGSFDEHKVMYGFGSVEEAKAAYLANYSPGWNGLGAISEVSKEEFRKWIDSSHRKTKPFAEYRTVDKDGVQRGGIDLDREAAEAVAFTTGRTAEEVAAEREEARRAPLRERIHEWERQVGVKANIIESLDEVKNAAARRAILNGDAVSGWFEKRSGEVYIYMPGTADVAEVDKTYMHEVVAHKGVRELLGEERFNRLMDSVWNDVMSEKDRKDWTAYVRPDMPGRSEEDIRRAAADEYVANLAENLSAEDNRSAWDKFVARVREILRDMGFDIRKEDIQDILRESYENLRKGAKSSPRKEDSAATRPRAQKAQKASKEAKIDDFGEKIGGARKDQARERIRDSFKLSAKDLVELKDPDKILSRKQIAKYLAEGQMTNADAQTLLAANMAVRSASGMDSYRAALMMKYRALASDWEKGADLSFDITDADVDYVFGQYSERIQQMPNIRDRIRKDFEHHLKDYADYKRTYEALDYPNTARQIKSAYIREGRVDGKFWVVAGANAYRGWPYATFEEAVVKMESIYPEVVNVEKEAKKAKDSGDEKTGHLKVVKDENGYYRVKSNLIPGQIFLSKRFYTRKDAEAYLNDNAEALVEKETKMSYALMGSNIGMVQREGRDYRGGKDVTEKMFMDTFAPRGVEFGNWVPQAERQEYLNKTYDAIMDFCQVVGISPKAFFLGGRLAVAFGARGKGGALAHYEPVKEVINLTRMKGAGSLAHEWFHAIDNQLSKQKTGNTSDMATDTKNVVREEVATAFREFVTAMNALDYSRRSRRAGEYWGEVWERAARLFADYTYNELGGKGIVSPLLARKPDEIDEQSEDFILSVWPYATKQENAAMKPYFDRLFAAIQEEEGTGVLFRKSGADRKKAQLDIIQAFNPMLDDYHTGIRSEKDILTLPEAVEAARKEADAGGWKELAAYPDITNRMLENAVKSGKITVFSSYPIENGVFVTPSRMQAMDYAGGEEVFSKTVPIDDVAWISTDEGQFARVEDTRFRKVSSDEDARYMDAISRGDMAAAQQMVDRAAEESGYTDRRSNYQGNGSWAAPSASVERDQFRDLDAFAECVENGWDVNLYAIANGVTPQPDDYFSINGPRYYGYDDAAGRETVQALAPVMRQLRNGERPTVKIYRAVPVSVEESHLRNGDWVSPSKEYVRRHGLSRFGEGGYRIIESEVLADHLWWDGNDAREWGYDDGKAYAYKNTGNNLKSLDPVTYDNNGNVIPLSRRFDEKQADTRFRKANQNQLGLVSNAEFALDRIKMEKATPEQWVKMLEKEGGLKAGEDKWLGLSDWLKSQNKKSLTKDEVRDYIGQNMIQIEEEHYGEADLSALQDEFDQIYDGLIDGIEDDEQEIDYEGIDNWHDFSRAIMSPKDRAWDELRERHHGGDDFDMAFSLDDRMRIQVDDEDAAGYFLGMKPINYTRSQYTTAGLQNNREIALTVPTIEPWHEHDEIHFGDAGEGRAVAWIRFGETTTRTPATKEEIEAYENAQPKAEEWRPFVNARGNTVYFPKGNRMSHDFVVERNGRFTVYLNEIALNTEATLEAAVKSLNHTKSSYAPNELKSRRILVIDEIQSNRHQQGREKGYSNKGPENEAYRAVNDAHREWLDIVKEVFGGEWKDAIDDDGVKQSYLEQVPAADVARILDAQYKLTQARFNYDNARNERVMKEEAEGLPPAAPFEKNWHELAMKRMLRLAAEEGYDKIAWTTGDQQADRYDIGNYVSSIDRTEADEGERSFGLYLGDSDESTEVVVDEDGKVIRAEGHLSQAIGKPLEELVGKDIAAKMMRMEEYDVIEDVDLKMGNEGMRGFYDDILPRFMNKYGKKWGVRVQDIELPDLGNTGLTMHSVDVTPEMKESVMEGQTMFRKSSVSNSETAIAGDLYDRYENQDGMDFPWMSENELIDRIEEELPYGVNTRNIFAKIDEYRRLDQEDFDEGRRDFSGSDRDSVFEEILSGLEKLAEDDGATRFRKVPLNRETVEEMESIKAVAFTTGRLGLAPNGKKSKLSEENWALVRTKAFKRWFGDWEIAAMETPIHKSKGTFKNLEAAEEWAKENLQGKSERNIFTGDEISIGRKSINEMLTRKTVDKSVSAEVHKAALRSVLDFIRTGIPGEVHKDTHGRGFDVMRLFNAFEVDGKIYRVKSTVRKINTGDRYYTYEVQEMEIIEGTPEAPTVGLDGNPVPSSMTSNQEMEPTGERRTNRKSDEQGSVATNGPINSITGAKLLKGVKKTNSSDEILDFSKVVDANGEPMVLFHQTEGDITQFDPRHPGAGTSDYMTPFGIFLKPTPNDIGLRGKLQIPLFASIRNPLVFESRTDLVRWLEENVPGYKAGADRLKDIDWEYGRKNDKAWEVDEKVFLDLREQRINKEITEEEFRRRFDEYQSESQKVLDEWNEASRELAVQMKDMIGTYLRGSGYDGVHIRKDAGSFGRVVETYIALEPSQVKSATDNNGDYDPDDPDTRFRKIVTPEQDAEYMDAVESGDMEKAQRMVREAAAATMPESVVLDRDDLPKKVLHGTNSEFNIFDERKIGSSTDAGWLGRGFYFYGNAPEYASQYGKRIIGAYLNIENPYFASVEDMDRLAEANSREASVEFRQELEDEGYDGVFYNEDLNEEWVAFYPNQIKSADPVTYDDLGNIVPLSNRFNPESNDIRFRKRTKPAPEKTSIGYKVFYQKDGKLYPPMVANPGGVDTPVGVWLDAEAAPVVGQTKTGRPQVKAGGKGTQGGSGTLAFRPGWHLGEIPYALQFGRLNPETGKKDLFPKDFVWAEVEYAADKSYQLEADANGMTEGGKYRHSYAGLKRLPEDGFYRYRTNPNPETDPWIITGSMKVNRVLSREEVDELVRKAGREPQKVEGDDTRLRKPEQKKTIPPLRRPAPAPEMAPAALVRKVEGGGLRAILGDERTKEFYESVYQVATPEEVQALAEKANEPGYDLFRAVKEYLADLAEKGFENDDTGMLRNAAFRLSLQIDSEGSIGDNVLQYILWRNGRRYNRSDQVAEAANVNMKVRLKVGEYAGETLADKTGKGMSTVNEETKEARTKLAREKQAAVKKMPKTSADLLQKVTKAMSAQREYDRATVDSITSLAKTLINEGGIDSVSAREMGRLMSIVSRATGKATLQRSADQLVDFMARHILKTETDALAKMTKVKASKEKQPGVDVQDKLDPEGQLVVKALKDGMILPVEAIDRRMTELQDKRDKGKLARMEADAEIAGLTLAREYAEKVVGSEQEEEELKQAVKDARFEKQMTPKTYREFAVSTEKAILENVIERIQALRDIRARLADVIAASGERAVLWSQKEQERVDAIRHDANRDLEGMPAEEQGHEMSSWDKFKGSDAAHFITAPLGTFDQLLRFLGRKSPDGRGYLFQRFMAMWDKSTSAEWQGLQEAYAILDAKVKEVFGDEVSRWSDLYRVEQRIDREHAKKAGAKHTLKFWDGTKMVEKELSSGNLLYIYMVDKMVDGQMKLRRMGITEEDVDRIKQELDPRFIALADWIQEDFLVERRLKYDETHRRMFGSSMASIDNYFPLRVLANAREREEEVGGQPEGQQMPSKFTGSIIKRRRNSLALDIVGSDAFSVAVEHIQEMEKWSAWAEFKRDLGTLLSYRHFRNQLENMSTVYGSGKGEDSLFENFKKVCEIAAGVYRPQGRGAIDKTVTNLVRGVSSAKVSFRVFTALKQTLSLPAFLADARVDLLAKSMVTPGRSWKWCMENLPVFQKRWKSRQAGNEKLQDTELDWKYWRTHFMQLASRFGMSPNAFVDALTVSVGSYAVYQTRLRQYLKDGYTQEKAEEKAKLDATVSFNESQQSSEGAFLSVLQSDRTVVANGLSVYRNSSFGYGRRFYRAAGTLKKMSQEGYKQESIEFMKKQFVEDGLTAEQAERAAERAYRRAFGHALADMAVFGFGVQFAWNLGPYAVYMLLGGGGDDDKWWNGKKEEDMTDAVMHALVGGWSEGLAGGSIVSEMVNMARKGDSFRNYDPTLLPALSDIKRIAKTFENDKVAGAVDVANLLVQSGFGFNPETFTDIYASLYDACNGDLGLAKESLIAAMRILQVPQSQVDQFLLDELDLTGEEYDDVTLPALAERYARYQIRRGAPGVAGMYDDAMQKKLGDKYVKRFMDKAKEARKVRGSGFDREFLTYLDEDYKETKAELQDLKDNAAIDPEGYAAALDEFYSSPEFAQYKLADLIKKTRKGIEKAEKNSRNRTELIKNLNDYKKEFLDRQAALKDNQNK